MIKIDWTSFFTAHNGLYSILLALFLFMLLFFLRVVMIRRITDNNIIKYQAPELRDKVIILRDGYEVKLFKQIVDKSATIIIGIHGLQGQKDDFKLLSSFCKKEQLSLITYDRRGMGKNERDWKFKSLGTDINDLKDIINAVKSKYPQHDIVVFGESIGAAIASHAVKNNNKVAALIVSNLVTKKNLYQFSLVFCFIFTCAFLFNSNIEIPVYIDSKDISSSKNYITNIDQRYSKRQNWSLQFLMQFKKINKSSIKIISNNKKATLILQSADDVFSDFHQLKINKKYWKYYHKYVFILNGKHALINEPNIKEIFEQEIMPWITENVLFKKGTTNENNT